MNENTITFKPDTAERKRFFKAASFSHPAKMILGLQIYLIEHYTKVGDTILDPMAGSGTALIGCTLGRNMILVELEDKFVKMQEANWEKIKSLGPMLGHRMGEATILQGDARNLDGMLADNILFSPPYTNRMDGGDKILTEKGTGFRPYTDEKPNKWFTQRDQSNIGNLPYGAIDAVISSPPYEGILERDRSKDNSYREDREKTHAGGSVKIGKGYQADAVITSPPYEEGGGHGGKPTKCAIEKKQSSMGQGTEHLYGSQKANIGNLKSENYLSAMAQVYEQCHKALKPDGVMCIVVKNFIRDKKIIRLDLDTIKLCEQAGFVLKERLARKLTQQSFWRTIYHKKFPDVEQIEHEDILIFRPDGAV